MTHHYDLRKYHQRWLKRLNHRCQWSNNIAGKKVDRKYRPYHFHHTHSGAYDNERPGWNLLLLTPSAHNFVHWLGGVWFWEMSQGAVRTQNRRANKLPLPWLWRYPNLLQRGFHIICRAGGLKTFLRVWLPIAVGLLLGWLYWPEISNFMRMG